MDVVPDGRARPFTKRLVDGLILGYAPILSRTLFAAIACTSAHVASAEPPIPAAFTETIPGTTVQFDMVPVPAGTVSIPDPASPGNQKTVEVGPFFIMKTESTWDMYDVWVFQLDEGDAAEGDASADVVSRPSKPYIPPDRGFGHAGYPTISVHYKGANEFCRWLSEKTGRKYRLPTEAEWQHAALAGNPGPYGFGADAASLGDFAWFEGNSSAKTQPIGQKKPNAWGIHDMHGNVQEWVIGMDGKPITAGGSYRDPATGVVSSSRSAQTPSWNVTDPQIPKSKWWMSDGPFVGFRIVCDPPDSGTPGDGHDATP